MDIKEKITHLSIYLIIAVTSFVIGFSFTFIHDSRQAFYDHYSFSLELLELEKLIIEEKNEEKVEQRLELLISYNDNSKLKRNGDTQHE